MSSTASVAVEHGSASPSSAGLSSAAGSSSGGDNASPTADVLPGLASDNAYPHIPWLHEAWLLTANFYERFATASPLVGVRILTQQLVQQHINMLPTISGEADFLHVFSSRGEFLGSRPKMLTWPLSQQQAMKVKEWAA